MPAPSEGLAAPRQHGFDALAADLERETRRSLATWAARGAESGSERLTASLDVAGAGAVDAGVAAPLRRAFEAP